MKDEKAITVAETMRKIYEIRCVFTYLQSQKENGYHTFKFERQNGALMADTGEHALTDYYGNHLPEWISIYTRAFENLSLFVTFGAITLEDVFPENYIDEWLDRMNDFEDQHELPYYVRIDALKQLCVLAKSVDFLYEHFELLMVDEG